MPDKLQNFMQQAWVSLQSAKAIADSLIKTATAAPSSGVDVTTLESRVLLSATPLVVPADVQEVEANVDESVENVVTDGDSQTVEDKQVASETTDSSPSFETEIASQNLQVVERELVFVDSAAGNFQQLVDDLIASSDEKRSFEVILLDENRDGIEQITSHLSSVENVSAIHIVSHGEDGAIRLGNTLLSEESIGQYVGDLSQWQQYVSASILR